MTNSKPNPALTDPELDAALGSDHERILPSSGFADAVMSAVHHEAAAPAPIPFPWKRALPGMIAAAVVLSTMLAIAARAFISFLRQAVAAPTPASSRDSSVIAPFLHIAVNPNVLWPALALVLPLLCLLLLRRVLLTR